jgi:hypothetical protein
MRRRGEAEIGNWKLEIGNLKFEMADFDVERRRESKWKQG